MHERHLEVGVGHSSQNPGEDGVPWERWETLEYEGQSVVLGYVQELWDPKFISEPSAHCHFKDLHIVKDVVLDLSWKHEL